MIVIMLIVYVAYEYLVRIKGSLKNMKQTTILKRDLYLDTDIYLNRLTFNSSTDP